MPKKKVVESKEVIPTEIPTYTLNFEDGKLSETHEIYRAFIVDNNNKECIAIDSELISCGFGHSRQKAIEDFINRNNSQILSKIFERSNK